MDRLLLDALRALNSALELLPPEMTSRLARVQLIAIGLQESRLAERRQIVSGRPVGPAAGLLQFEEGGGVKGVLNHRTTQLHAQALCAARGVAPDRHEVWQALARDDILAFGFGRLLLWTDPAPLPDDPEGAWQYYLRTWRPGAAERQYDVLRAKWSLNYLKAQQGMADDPRLVG